MMPSGWESAALGALVEAPISYGVVQPGDRDPSGVPFVRGGDFPDGSINLNALRTITRSVSNQFRRTQLRGGEILVSLVGYPGACTIAQPELSGANIARQVALVRPKNGIETSYLFHYLRSPVGQALLLSKVIGSAQQVINLKDLRDVVIAIPPLSEQRRIAEILSTWDRAIKTVEALIASAREQKKALMQSLLSQGAAQPKMRLQGFSGEWTPVRLGQVVTEVSRDVDWDDDATYRLISVRRRSEGIFHRESLAGHSILTKVMKIARSGDFLISKMQIVHGASALVIPEFDGYHISGSYIALVPKDHSNLDMQFFNWCSRTPHFRELAYVSSYGVHIEKMTFNLKSFLNQTILVPPTVAEQVAIVSRLSSAEDLIGSHERELVALREEKVALMQQLLTGKRRVELTEDEAVQCPS